MIEALNLLKLKNFQLKSLKIKSKALKGNPLKDSFVRSNPILLSKEEPKALVFILAGFGGNGPNYLGLKSFEDNFPQLIDKATSQNKVLPAHYIFVDAWSKIGGSQFINSSAVGNYEDYIIKEIVPYCDKYFGKLPKVIMGGSSGGYGALHLASKYPNLFSYAGAIAPDSYFEAGYLPDLYKAANYFSNPKFSTKSFLKSLESGDLLELRDFHTIINSFAMSACYSPKGKEVDFPIDFYSGNLKESVWKRWKEKDPVVFLEKRKTKLKKLKGLFLEVGKRDQFYLYFGSRQIHKILSKAKIKHHYHEFDGNHFDISKRRASFLEWLSESLIEKK